MRSEFWLPVLVGYLFLVLIAGQVVTADDPPAANFTATPRSGPAPLYVQFNDTSTNSPTAWSWSFGEEDLSTAWKVMNLNPELEPRVDHASVSLPNGDLLIIGGYHDVGDFKNDTWRSADNGVTWTRIIGNAPWEARFSHGVDVATDGSFILTGGHGYSSSYFAYIAPSYMNKNDTTESTNIASEGSLILTGGHGTGSFYTEDNTPSYEYKNDTWRSTDNGHTWTRLVENAPWEDRGYHCHVVMPDGSIILMGGAGKGYYNDTWRSTDNGRTWTRLTEHAEWTARAFASCVVMPDGSIILMGGNFPWYTTSNEVWRSADNGATWTLVNGNAPWSPRVGQTSVVLPDGSIFLMGGDRGYDFDGGFHHLGYLNDTWRSTDYGATWSQVVNTNPVWLPRFGHTSVLMPDGSVVLAGGANGVIAFNDIWRFQPGSSFVQNPSHTYTTPGTYTVSLTASNAEGSDTEIKEDYIHVTPEKNTYSMTNTFSKYAGRDNCENMTSALKGIGWGAPILYNSMESVTKADFGVNPLPNQKTLNDATLHYHVGHGSVPYFKEGDAKIHSDLGLLDQPNNSLSPEDVENTWGNMNKWVILHSCYALQDERWGKALSTSHGVLGFKTMVNVNPEFTSRFFHYAIDEKKTIYSAYRLATYALYSNDPVPTKTIPGTGDPDYSSPKEIPVAAVVFGNISQAFGDHLPDIGTGVIQDAVGDTLYRDEWRCNEDPR